jgi:hypothetical protein
MFEQLRRWLFGGGSTRAGRARRIGTSLIRRIAHGELRQLEEAQLMELVDFILTTPQLRYPLRGNTRFLDSVAAQYHRKRQLSARQLQAVFNILERAYPHNLAAELKRFV